MIAREALESIRADERERAKQRALAMLGDPTVLEKTVKTDDEARRLADTPHLTGDPEFDAIELAETDPSRDTRK